jgi:DNA-binding NarL/FixJ family response regulator
VSRGDEVEEKEASAPQRTSGPERRLRPRRAVEVVLADDDVHTRTGVCLALEEDGFSVVAEVRDASAALEATMRLRPDLLLIEVKLPGAAIEAIATIRREAPTTAVVVLTTSFEECEMFDALRAGACGYLLKDVASSRLPDALRAVLRGEPALARVTVARLIKEVLEPRTPPAAEDAGLTPRQRQVLDLLRRGLTTAEIAAQVSVSEVTVRRHLSDVRRKTGASDREALRRQAKPAA